VRPARTCPELARLREHLEGTLPEGAEAELMTHLDLCAPCQQALEELAVEGAPLLAVARQVGREPPTPGPALDGVLRLLEGQCPGEAADGGADESALRACLGLTGEPGRLGRLGPYEVREVLGHGGMGVVFKAFDLTLQRVVALKVLAAALAASATARQRFVREARAAAAVRHDHVIDIHAVEEAQGLPYLVMEYVAGGSLQERLDRHGPPLLAEIVRIGAQTAAGLAAAHAHGLVHRDVKPANILLDEATSRVKITDFGLARVADDASLTQSGTVAGTPQYMAPEQARGEAVAHRADLFSLGSVLYALCTGQSPFRASGAMATLKRVCEDTPRPIREINPEVPEWLAAVIAKLQAKDPAERFPSAAEVGELLSKHLAHLQQPALIPAPARTDLVPRPTFSRRHPRRRWAAAVLLLLLGGLSLTEATGVTRLAATVIRILTPDGTLVIEVDDPNVKVSIEGPDGVVFTGAGPREVRLRPGSYRCRATQDGTLLKTELVTVTRDNKPVFSARLEPPDELPVGEVRRFEGHTEPVHGLAVSADGARAVTGSWGKTVRVWDVARGKELRYFCVRDPTGQANHAIYCVALSPDGHLALAGSRHGTVWLWDVETGEERARCAVPVHRSMGATALAFSLDGQYALVAGADGVARLWRVSPWKEVRRLEHSHRPEPSDKNVWSVCFSPDGRQALTVGAPDKGEKGGEICIWDLHSGAEVRRFNGHEHGVWCAVFSPCGRFVLSGGGDAMVRLWDAGTGKELRRFPGHTAEVLCVAFSPDGRQALSSGGDRTIRLWDVEKGTELHRFFDRERLSSWRVAFVPRSRQALSGNYQGTVRLWQLPP
jgi:serine/threonine protein kinase/WD40 repeat protein